MNSQKIFVGPIHKIMSYDSIKKKHETLIQREETIVEPHTILIKLSDNEYIRLQDYRIYLIIRKIYPEFMKDKIISPLDITSLEAGKEFILEEELTQFLSIETDVSLKRVKERNKL